jgi:hypothetical protein
VSLLAEGPGRGVIRPTAGGASQPKRAGPGSSRAPSAGSCLLPLQRAYSVRTVRRFRRLSCSQLRPSIRCRFVRGIMIRRTMGAVLVCCLFAPPVRAEPRVGRPPAHLGVDRYYEKHLDVGGVAVLASAKVADAALSEAAKVLRFMTHKRPELLRSLARYRIRFAVIGRQEETTDIPEYRDLEPRAYWNARVRGFGATVQRPVVSCGEENLLRLPEDRYKGTNSRTPCSISASSRSTPPSTAGSMRRTRTRAAESSGSGRMRRRMSASIGPRACNHGSE